MQRVRIMLAGALVLLAVAGEAQARTWLESTGEARLEAQLLENPGLEAVADGLAADWSGWDEGKYELDAQVSHSGDHSARCVGADQTKQYGVGQTVVLEQQRPTPLVARAWSKAEGVSGTPDNNYSLYLDLEYMDGTPLWGQVTPFSTGTHDWQQVTVVVMPARPVRSVNVYGIFRSHAGRAWFDDFELYEMGGAGQFDLSPAVGTVPEGAGPWEKMDLGRGRSLFVDTKTGAISLDGRRLGGLVVRDVAAGSGFVLPELAVSRQDEGLLLKGVVEGLDLALEASLKVEDGAARLDGTVRDGTGRDRAVTVYLALPVEEAEWAWCQDPRRSYPATSEATCANFRRSGAGAVGLHSHYPFAPICGPEAGLCVGAPISVPRLARFAYDPRHRVLYAAFDLGLSQATAKFPGAASFSAVVYSFDPLWRFRSALLRYYGLNGDAFTRRVAKQGIWMPFVDIATVDGWEDFGFQFQEGAPNPAFDEEHGIYSFPYIEPMSFWMAMPEDMPREDEEAMKLLRRLASEGNNRASATLSSGVWGPGGRLAYAFENAPWCNGAVFLLNPDPDLPGIEGAPVTQFQVHQGTLTRILENRVGAAGWGAYGAGHEIVQGEGRDGSRCARCVRVPGAQPMGLHRDVRLDQKEPRPFVATAWSKAEDVSGDQAGDYSLYMDVMYADGGHLWGRAAGFETGSHDWQQVTVRVEPEKPVRNVALHLLLRGERYGKVWFDDVSLREEGRQEELVKDGGFEAPAVKVKIDGLYLDSFEMAATLMSYRREHFASADIPLVFDRGGQVCQLGHFLAMELAMNVADTMHAQDRLMFANAALHAWPWPAGCLDVFGTETNWMRGGKYAPDTDEQMLYWRAMCYQRPYLTLQNTEFENFPHEVVELYFQRCCYYGVLPSFFSHDASTKVYWNRPELYNRDRDLFRKYQPVIRRIAEAGWEPITWAKTDDEDVWVERYGDGDEVFLAVFNNAAEAREAEVAVDLAGLAGGRACRAEVLLPEAGDLGKAEGPEWRWKAELEPGEVAVLRLGQ